LGRYDQSSISEIHQRIGKEIPERTLRQKLKILADAGEIRFQGERKYRKYFIDKNARNK
jgi:ATP-dependent DNA helicase RecG